MSVHQPVLEQNEAVLSCNALQKIYRMGEVEVRALDRIDFVLHAGELLVLLGASGSGKSTLLNILGGLDVPTAGTVQFRSEELTNADEDALTDYRRHHVGFVFQFYNLIPSLTARENVALVTDIPQALEVVVDLLTTDAVQIQLGTEAVIDGWGGAVPLAGRVRKVEPSGFTRPSALGVDEQRVNVVIALTDPQKKWAAFGDGYRVEARFVLWQATKVLKAPQGAIFRAREHWAVFRVDDGIAHLVPVNVGHRGETEVEITSGLTAGAALAVHPGDRVKDGVRVEAR